MLSTRSAPKLAFLVLAGLTLLVFLRMSIQPQINYWISQYTSQCDVEVLSKSCSSDARFLETREAQQVIDCVKDGMTFFTQEKLEERAKLLQSLSTVDGAFVEAGVALGGTAILTTHIASGRPVHLYDVFGMIPPPEHTKDTDDAKERYETIKSGASRGFGNSTYYGYLKDVLSQVKRNFDMCQVSTACVEFHKGLVEDTMKNIDFDVAYLHCDTDFYSAVYHCLVDGAPHVQVHGYIVIDDYFSYGSAQQAYDDYFSILNDTHVATSRNHVYYKTVTNVMILERVL